MKRVKNARRLIARTLLLTIVSAAVTAGCVYHYEVREKGDAKPAANDNRRL